MPFDVATPPPVVRTARRPSIVLRMLLALVLTVLGTTVSAVVVAPTASAASPRLTDFDNQMLNLVNNARYDAGLPKLQAAVGLTNLSLWWSGQMADGATGNVLQHNPNAFQQTLSYGASNRTAWAENVAKWSPTSVTADSIFTAYMNSAGHRANILGANYRYVGIASTTGNTGISYNTMTFTDRIDPGQVVQPTGNVDSIAVANGQIRVVGWGYDPLSPATSIPLHVYVNGVGYANTAGLARPDVNNAFGVSGKHGYDITVPAVNGSNQVCIYAISVTGTPNTTLFCTTVTWTLPTPLGNYDSVSSSGSNVTVVGWTYDPNQPASAIPVHVYINGTFVSGNATNVLRQDANNAFAISGNHGFSQTVNAPAGNDQVCVYGVSVTGASSTALGCRMVSVAAVPASSGNMDSITRTSGGVRVVGWAYDPASPSTSVQVHVYVGSQAVAINANAPRPDANSAFGISGNHGFDQTVAAPASGVTVCLYAISVSGGANTNLGCKAV